MQPATSRKWPLVLTSSPPHIMMCCLQPWHQSTWCSHPAQEGPGRTSGINCCLRLLQLAHDVLQAGILWPVELLAARRPSQVTRLYWVFFGAPMSPLHMGLRNERQLVDRGKEKRKSTEEPFLACLEPQAASPEHYGAVGPALAGGNVISSRVMEHQAQGCWRVLLAQHLPELGLRPFLQRSTRAHLKSHGTE